MHFVLEYQRQQMQLQQQQQQLDSASSVNAAAAVASEQSTSAAPGDMSPGTQWLAQQLGIPHLTAPCFRGDVQQVLSSSLGPEAFFREPAALASHAMSAGILLPEISAVNFSRNVVRDAAAWQVLDTQYPQLHRRLLTSLLH